jgi:membrane-associated phospholipid phosphatase
MNHFLFFNLLKGLAIFFLQSYSYMGIRRYLKHKISDTKTNAAFVKKFFTIPSISWIDSCPYYSWTIVPYMNLIPHIISVFFFLPEDAHGAFVLVFIVMNCITNIIFILWPTAAPNKWIYHYNSEKELTGYCDPLVKGFLSRNQSLFFQRYVKKLVCPLEAAPSTHTTLSMMPVFFCFLHQIPVPFWYCLWSLSIALSTIPMKQHYFFDFLSGLVVASVVPLVIFYIR